MDIDTLTKQAETIVRCVLTQDTTEYLEMLSLNNDVTLIETLPASLTDLNQMKTLTSTTILDIGLRTRFCYKWLQAGMLQQPKFDCEVRRKPRKGYRNTIVATKLGSILDDDDENNIRKQSNITVTWGRCHFGFVDRCYFYEDGTLALIDRSVAPVEDVGSADYLAERTSFLNEGKSKVNPQHIRPPVLDFSFRDLTDVVDLLRTDPDANKKSQIKAKKHKRAKVFVPKEEKVDERNVTYNPNTGAPEDGLGGGSPGGATIMGKNVMIRAKNKKGEEEAYEFQVTDDDRQTNTDNKAEDDQNDAIVALSKGMKAKFSADSIRLCNNLFQETDRIIPVLRSLVVDSVLTVTWIDISCNRLNTIPQGLEHLYLLSTLYLHGNQIANWEPIRAMRRNLTKLHTITLFGNPIATNDRNYKETALSILLNVPTAASAPLKSLDFVALSKQDKVVTKMFEQFHPPVERKKENASKIRERTQRLQATMLDF